ncbi:cytochrome b [Uliginosibacterium sp. sgz301328]|uniref:cytochrome b n=1 Tax=Uliginosibacterium sp. sgz301328 TaxID=3243764 RepID=UPI00359E904A
MSSPQYSTPTKLIHWLTAILVLVAFIYGPGGSETRVYSASRDFDRQLHETLGLCVLALSVIRLLWRAADKRPAPEDGARWMRRTASAVQVILFALLFIVPLTAISGAWLEGHPLTLLQSVTIAPPIQPSHELGATIAELHGWLGDVILWVAGLHAAAALFHHYVLKDNVLRRMLPSRG